MKRCSVPGCTAPHLARGFCNRHYKRYQRYGSPDLPAARPTLREQVIGANLRAIRERRGLTKVEFGVLLGYQQQHVARLERGGRKVSDVKLAHIAACLGVSAASLLRVKS